MPDDDGPGFRYWPNESGTVVWRFVTQEELDEHRKAMARLAAFAVGDTRGKAGEDEG